MSREINRTRPTREETRARLFEAAARVIEEAGVGAATIDQIVTEAGFTRGAFYSNFDSKDDLLIAMLHDHLAESVTRNTERLDAHGDAGSIIRSLEREERYDSDPLHRSPVLQIELILHVARRHELRPMLADRLRDMRVLVGDIAFAAIESTGAQHDFSRDDLGFLLVALEDGLRLHRLLDPSTTPDDAFNTALRRLLGLVDRSGLTAPD